jgi:tRNA threonylcarbamoyladenosine biosynthesis protein TsaE
MSDRHHELLVDENATRRLGYEFSKQLTPGAVLLLFGDLGSGKTTFVQGLAAGLGITGAVASPTFTLVNEYLEGRCPLYHLDLYRLEREEVIALHPEQYWEGLEVEPGIVAIEWSELLPYLPNIYWKITFAHQVETGRTVEILECYAQSA